MKKGLTLIEVLVVIGILAILFSLGTVIFGSFTRKDQALVEARRIEAILNEAKIKTISGFSLGEGQNLNFGVYFQTDRYVLFPGLTYDPQDSRNQEFLLPVSLEIVPIFFPENSVVFEKVTGEVLGFNPDQNYLILDDKKSQEKKKISLNHLGRVKIEDL